MMNEIYEAEQEELRRRERAERNRRARLEKEKQLRRRKMIKQLIKKLALPVIGLIVLVIVLSVGIHKAVVKAKEAKLKEVEEKEQAVAEQMIPTPTPEPEPEIKHYEYKEAENVVALSSENMKSTNAILVSLDKNEIIGKQDCYTRIVPASMTKVLTLLVAVENIEDIHDKVTMTYEATNWSYVNDCSAVGFDNDEVVTVEDLLYGTILSSGGDAAYQLALYVAGSQEAFVEMMNDKLEELGISETTHFTNVAGIHNADHYSTCYDIAVIMNAAIDNELCREVLHAHKYNTSLTEQHPEGLLISNWFLRRIEDRDTGGEVYGAKTGFVDESGCCAVSYAIQNDGSEYIAVSCHANSNWRAIRDHVDMYLNHTSISTGQAITTSDEINEEDTEASDN